MTKPQTTNPERVADSLPFIKQHILRRLGMSALGSKQSFATTGVSVSYKRLANFLSHDTLRYPRLISGFVWYVLWYLF
ncbi:hypothetical protein [Ruegeria atlantica]|uniref:Uncharacterized protein n=1 Tax=Ruegeria atlantica TaxID=81569 RepID=A0ABX1WBJ5_9RHOB|nr:hypothetical protein [Ruegeria atlantica]NOD30644.1 hypothetical protein [Ruegeria atlantica]